MSITIEKLSPSALEVNIQGKLKRGDYRKFVPKVEEYLHSNDRIGILLHISNFEGWSIPAIWQDLKFDFKHYKDISRLAYVSTEPSKRWVAEVSEPFTAAEIQFFLEKDLEVAREWVKGAMIY